MAFDLSLLRVLPHKPWRWTIPPNEDGTGGTKQELNGVFILFSDELVAILKEGLTQVQKDELQQWVSRYTQEQCAEWNVPVWAGQDSAVYLRVPAVIWDDPTQPPPNKVKQYFQWLWTEATN